MRQRYYNAEIKRFVNQDILAGSLDNSQSLNHYSYVQGNPVSYTDPFGLSPISGLFSDTNFTHCLLGLLSCIPGPVGAVASVADAAVYFFVDKDYGMAALSLMSAASMGLGSIATNIAKSGKMAYTAKLLGTTSNLLSNVASFGMNASAGMDMAYSMYEKYGIYGEKIDRSIIGEAAGLGMSILGCAISGKGIADDARKMGNMLGDAGFVNQMKREYAKFSCDVKTTVTGKPYCFVAGTLVHTSEGAVAIEDIKTGDYVLAYNEETGETGYKKVLRLFRSTTDELAHVKVAGAEEIVCTPGHKFYVEGEWIVAKDLESGDILTLADGTKTEVLSVTLEELETAVCVYNFEVEDWHNYYVANSGVLVHNNNTGCQVETSDGKLSESNTEIILPSSPHRNGTPGHWETILDEVEVMKQSGEYKKIYVNKGLHNEVPDTPLNNRPDIMGVRHNEKIDQVEVPSKTDTYKDLMDRMKLNKSMLGDRAGTIKVKTIGKR